MAPAGAKAGRQGDLATKGEVGQDRHCLSPRGHRAHPASWNPSRWVLWRQALGRLSRCFGDGGGDNNLPPVFCSSRVMHVGSRARLPVSTPPFISCVTLDRSPDLSVLQFLQAARGVYPVGLS